MWKLAGQLFTSRLLLGTAQYPDLQTLQQAIAKSETQILTVSLRRQSFNSSDNNPFWEMVKNTDCRILPNTAGCRTAKEAVMMANMAREIFDTPWIKLEVVGDDFSLQPDPFELLTAAKLLIEQGFTVFPYCTEDLVLCQRLVDCGCSIIMPWAAPIGSGKGLLNPYALEVLRKRLPDITLIIDAGIGKPSHAVQAMELGFDGVLLNTAVAASSSPITMASAFRHAVIAGRQAYEAGLILERNCALPSTSLLDTPFWNQEKTMARPIAWTIAGSDSSTGAGIQADLRSFHSFACHPASVITAITAQNSCGIQDISYLPAATIRSQILSLHYDLPPSAIKIGMLGNFDTAQAVFSELENFSCPIVLDPLLKSSSGSALHQESTGEYLELLQKFFPQVSLLTPNILEAEAIVGGSITSHADMKAAAQKILTMGVKSVLIKGGHLTASPYNQDYWTNGQEEFWLTGENIADKKVHGTGCVLSAAITASLAHGYAIQDALVLGKTYVTQAIRNAQQIGQGFDLPSHLGWPQGAENLPYISDEALTAIKPAFPDCGEVIALYPIVDSLKSLETLCGTGVTCVQLRIKNAPPEQLRQEIKAGIELARHHGIRLFINDYWQLAIDYAAYGVHLGQEDLQAADMEKIYRAGLRLGISTHSYYELARAARYKPSYLALGPIYPTQSKVMVFAPQGIQNLQHWRSLVACPLVAIGGIDYEQFPEVLSVAVDGIAVISAISKASDPRAKTKKLLQLWNQLTSVTA